MVPFGTVPHTQWFCLSGSRAPVWTGGDRHVLWGLSYEDPRWPPVRRSAGAASSRAPAARVPGKQGDPSEEGRRRGVHPGLLPVLV